MTQEHYVNKSKKLVKANQVYLHKMRKELIELYGSEKANRIISESLKYYPDIIPKIPFFNTPMYDSLIVLCSRMIALKKSMRKQGIDTPEFVLFSIQNLRNKSSKVPRFLRRIGGQLYISKPVKFYLKKVAKSASENGWPTQCVEPEKGDAFAMKVCTQNCGMLNFIQSLGEGDLKPYCSFFDFTSAEMLGLGLEQVSNIDSGSCNYCFYKKGAAKWPDTFKNLSMLK